MFTHAESRPRTRGDLGWTFGNVAGEVRRVDWILVLAVLALGMLGALLVWAATLPGDGGDPLDSTHHLTRHLVLLVTGFVVCLVLELAPLGAVVNGSRGWFVAGGFQFQPSELMEVGLIMVLATLLGEPRDGETEPMTRDVLFCLLVLVTPLALVVLQPDLGTAL